MVKGAKVDLLSILVSAIVIFVVYAMLASGVGPILNSPANFTNASLTRGFADAGAANASSFNAANPQFNCSFATNASAGNITRVVLFINKTSNVTGALDNNTAIINLSIAPDSFSTAENARGNFLFNVTTSFGEGSYLWACQQDQNNTPGTKIINFSSTSTFTIDLSGSAITNNNVTNTSNAKVSTGDTISIAANFSDRFTVPDTVRLFVNFSGIANNEVNISGGVNGLLSTAPSNNTQVNLSFKVLGNSTMGTVLNVTMQVNDSVNNINITQALIFLVEGDGTPPGPINITDPINLFNTSSGTVLFNFTAFDNNDTEFNCDINISKRGGGITEEFQVIRGLNVTSGVAHQNSSTTLTNGTYVWQVNCSDGPGNTNGSASRNFTVDSIPPIFGFFNITNASAVNTSQGDDYAAYQLGALAPADVPATGAGTWAQGRTLFVQANWSDNLTQPFMAVLQFYNVTDGVGWQTINVTDVVNHTNGGFSNFSFLPKIDRNEFEGRNVSFRIIANDTLGNVNLANNRFNSSEPVVNITVNINDTFAPTVIINGTLSANNSFLSNTAPLVSWVVAENNALRSINISVDAQLPSGTGFNGCRAAFYDTSSGVNNVERNRNGSFTIDSSDAGCRLGNGTHAVNVTAIDSWGNRIIFGHVFSIQTGSAPVLAINLTNLARTGPHSRNSINASNITSSVGIQLSGTNGAVSVDKISYVSSCDPSTTVVINNYTTVYPFNSSSSVSCGSLSANRTLTITINDTVGNSVTNVTTFLVDNVAPTITVNSPTSGQTFADTNSTLSLFVSDDDQAISFVGYYLDGNDTSLDKVVTLNISSAIGVPGATTNITNFANLTGTHRIKFTANDTLGNVRNSSVITFSQTGPINFVSVNSTIFSSNNDSIANLTFFDSDNNIVQGSQAANRTLALFVSINQSTKVSNGTNITITFNGTAANWDAANEIYIRINDVASVRNFQNNQTSTVLNLIYVNRSFANFLSDNNSYLPKVSFTFNLSNTTETNVGGKRKFSYFPDEADLTLGSSANVTECTINQEISLTSKSGLPCWNNSANKSIDIYVPHFSIIVFSNDSDAPSINVSGPSNFSNQSVSMFIPNITVAADTVDCKYITNGSSSNITMTKSGNVCLGQLERYKNFQSDSAYSILFYATDGGNNINTYNVTFNVTDNTKPTSPNGTRVSSSVSTTSATVTVTDINETVNATVLYGTAITTLSSNAVETDFNTTQAISLTGLSANTLYYYNVSVCDFNGNCIQNGTFNFTTSAEAAASSSAAAASSGSSGGGGGAAASTGAVVTDSKAQVWSTIPKDSAVTLNVNKATVAVTSIEVTGVKSELSNVELSVGALSQKPSGLSDATPKVYQYLSITKKNIQEGDATFNVGFRVTKAWLSENGLSSADVSLYRYNSEKWNELTTSVVSSDDTYVNYKASTPGFSYFAVGSKSAAAAPAETPIETPTEAPAGTDEGAPTPVEAPKAVEAPGKAPVAWLIAAVVVILGIILIVMYQKKKQG